MLESFWAWTINSINAQQMHAFIQACILLIAGFILARFARLAVMRLGAKSVTAQQRMILRRTVSYAIFMLFFISAMRELGFNFGVLLGAAGIVSVAIGFASQTSVSNIISGLFLVAERAIEVGDIAKIGDVTGEVLSIDILSTKLRTFDNLLVRIPNETVVKAQITNLNRFPIRRIDLQIGVAYKEDLEKMQNVLFELADKNTLILEEPAPLLISQGFGDSSINYQFSVWGQTKNYLDIRNQLQQDVKEAFEENDIEIPFPHLSIYSGTTPQATTIKKRGTPQGTS